MKIIEKWILTKGPYQVVLMSRKYTYLKGARDINDLFGPPKMTQNRDFP